MFFIKEGKDGEVNSPNSIKQNVNIMTRHPYIGLGTH